MKKAIREQTPSRSEAAAPAAPAVSARWVGWVLLGTVVLAALLDLLYYTGFFGSDDLQYTRGALQVADTGHLSYLTPGTIRLGVLLPLALAARVSHHSIFAMTTLFIGYHLLLVLGTYWLGRVLHGAVTGLLAAGFLATCPLAVLFASMILPDHATTALMVLAVGSLFVGLRQLQANPESRRPYWMLAGAGLLFGLSLTAKEAGIMVLPALLLLLLFPLRARPLRRTAKLLVCFGAGMVVAGLLYGVAFRAVAGLWTPLQSSLITEKVAGYADRVAAKPYAASGDRFSRLISFGLDDSYLSVFTWLIPLALVTYPFLRRRSWFVYATFIWLCLYMTWGTFSISRYAPPPMQMRYFIFPLPFAMIMVAYMLTWVGTRVWQRVGAVRLLGKAAVGGAVLLGLVVVVLSCQRLDYRAGTLYYAGEVSGVRQALEYAAANDERPVVLSYWLSARTAPGLPPDEADLIETTENTGPEDVSDYLRDGGFLYVDSDVERLGKAAFPKEPSPLDVALREAEAGDGGTYSVRPLGGFSQFATRSLGWGLLYGGVRAVEGLRNDNRRVYLYEVTQSK